MLQCITPGAQSSPWEPQGLNSAEGWSPASLMLRIKRSKPACLELSMALLVPRAIGSSHSRDANVLYSVVSDQLPSPFFQDPRWQFLFTLPQRQTLPPDVVTSSMYSWCHLPVLALHPTHTY